MDDLDNLWDEDELLKVRTMDDVAKWWDKIIKSNPVGMVKVLNKHKRYEEIVKANESLGDRIQRWRDGYSGMWYIVRRDHFKHKGKRVSLITLFEEPPDIFVIRTYGVGVIDENSPIIIPKDETIVKTSIQNVKRVHQYIKRLIKSGRFVSLSSAVNSLSKNEGKMNGS